MNNTDLDVIIIGGSYAGLSAALALGRSLRNVLIIDSGEPCNRPTPHSHNFLTHDGKTPAELSALARKDVETYETVRFLRGKVTSATQAENAFHVTTERGESFSSRKLVIATGLIDEFLPIPGLAECWGISVVHCPYCHGYEFRQKKTGILSNGERAFHTASLVRNLTYQLTILTNGPADFSDEQKQVLDRHGIVVREEEVTTMTHEDGWLRSVGFDGGDTEPFDAVYAALSCVQQSEIPASLGCAFNDSGFIDADPLGRTNIPGLFACGDCCSSFRSLATAVGGGNITGAAVNKELVTEDFV